MIALTHSIKKGKCKAHVLDVKNCVFAQIQKNDKIGPGPKPKKKSKKPKDFEDDKECCIDFGEESDGEAGNNKDESSEIEDFEVNENGEKTKKLNISFEAELWQEGGGDSKTISGSAIIGVAYPE